MWKYIRPGAPILGPGLVSWRGQTQLIRMRRGPAGRLFVTAFSAIGACLNNLGPGLGDVASNYSGLDSEVKWLLMFAMMLGRLEIFTLLVLLTPSYWRR